MFIKNLQGIFQKQKNNFFNLTENKNFTKVKKRTKKNIFCLI